MSQKLMQNLLGVTLVIQSLLMFLSSRTSLESTGKWLTLISVIVLALYALAVKQGRYSVIKLALIGSSICAILANDFLIIQRHYIYIFSIIAIYGMMHLIITNLTSSDTGKKRD